MIEYKKMSIYEAKRYGFNKGVSVTGTVSGVVNEGSSLQFYLREDDDIIHVKTPSLNLDPKANLKDAESLLNSASESGTQVTLEGMLFKETTEKLESPARLDVDNIKYADMVYRLAGSGFM